MITVPPTSFVGRLRELAWLECSDARGDRLVTLLGPGGIGKTRLALQHLDRMPGDAIVCDLSEAHTIAAWLEVVCGALEITLGPRASQADAIDPIGHVLAARGEVRVLLDNMEQLVELAPQVLSRWRALAPAARFLVTSRERLRLHGEVVLDVEPLGLPSADSTSSDAVMLFHERARAACASWDPSAADDRAIAEIVRRLDGFPLAIELAATRCRVLAASELLVRLESGLGALDHGTRDGIGRHHTLARAIAWSVDALPAHERTALARCSVFRGGFTATAAEAVIDVAAGTEPDAPTALDRLQALCDKSLIMTRTTAGVRRFDLYASIREVAARTLELDGSGARTETEARHAAYYLVLGEELVAVSGSDRRRALEAERDNLVIAHARCSARADVPELCARLALVLDDVLAWRGPLQASQTFLDIALTAAHALSPSLRGRILEARGRSFDASGRAAEARVDLEQALAVAVAERDTLTEARAHADLCVLARKQRRLDDAITHGARAVSLCRALDRPRLEGFALGALGAIALERGDLVHALEMMQRVREIAHADGDPWLEAMSLAYVAHAHHEAGRLDDAAATFDRAIAMFEFTGDRHHAAIFGIYRAMVDHERGELEAARDAYALARERTAALGIARFEGLSRACSGAASAQLGSSDDACRAFDQARRLLDGVGDPALMLALEIHRLHLLAHEDGGAARAAIAHRELVTGNPLVGASDDVRFAMRVLGRVITAPRGPEAAAAMVVASDGRWFRPPGAVERVSLFKQRALRRIMLALAETRVRSPGAALSWEQLLGVGWPGERMLASAGAHRVRVAISTLRGRGLRDVLRSRDDGYLLDPTVSVTVAELDN